MPSLEQTTQLTLRLSRGDRVAADELVPIVYDELRRLAARYLRRERSDHTLQPTALVNEIYLRLVKADEIDWQGRAQFFALAARQIRKILVEHARRKKAAKRGGDAARITLDESGGPSAQRDVELIALDDALARLANASPRQSQVVELRFFGGMRVEEVADVLGISATTVKDDWAVARAWLRRELSAGDTL